MQSPFYVFIFKFQENLFILIFKFLKLKHVSFLIFFTSKTKKRKKENQKTCFQPAICHPEYNLF